MLPPYKRVGSLPARQYKQQYFALAAVLQALEGSAGVVSFVVALQHVASRQRSQTSCWYVICIAPHVSCKLQGTAVNTLCGSAAKQGRPASNQCVYKLNTMVSDTKDLPKPSTGRVQSKLHELSFQRQTHWRCLALTTFECQKL